MFTRLSNKFLRIYSPSGFKQTFSKIIDGRSSAGMFPPDQQIRELSEDRTKPVLTLYTKDECSLCDAAMETLAPHLHKVNLEIVDITIPENSKWYKSYKYDIPVFHMNGEFLMKHKADLDIFHQQLAKIKQGQS